MSQVVSTPAQILNHPLNNSPAKMHYSFPKSKRMPEIKTPPCQKPFYDIPSTRSGRSTAFGYGTKLDFTQKTSKNFPAPNAYNMRDTFSRDSKRGYSFGLSRDAVSPSGSPSGSRDSPGPAKYDVREKNKVVIAFSFRPRTKETLSPTSLKSPGPGTYRPPESLTRTGRYFISKFKSSGVCTFSPPNSRRFITLNDGEKPGPGAYEYKLSLSPKGNYFLSTFKSSPGKTFGSSMSRSGSRSMIAQTPGPGSYRLPSDFGYYESGTLHKRSGSKV